VTRLYVKPAEGRAVPDPENGGELLPAAGRSVPNTAYWQRRLKDTDVIQAEPPKEPAPDESVTEAAPAAVVAPKASKGSKS
jgi:hypothetical protein